MLYSLRKLYWNFYSLNWDEFLTDSGYAEEIEQIVEIVNSNKNRENPSLLDLGCATGSYSTAFSKKHFSVSGLDYAEKMIRKARQKAIASGSKNIKFEVADFNCGLSFNNSQFDIVLTAHIFKAVVDIPFLTEEIVRVLKEDGLLVVVTKQERERSPAIREEGKSFVNFLLKLTKVVLFNDHKKSNFKYEDLRAQIESLNFIVHREYETAKNRVIIFQKLSLYNQTVSPLQI
ncbi:MAG: class I SAM-dependent methyltransferase [Ignavibacteriaceae bacterium]